MDAITELIVVSIWAYQLMSWRLEKSLKTNMNVLLY
jgi:hypothetical protein